MARTARDIAGFSCRTDSTMGGKSNRRDFANEALPVQFDLTRGRFSIGKCYKFFMLKLLIYRYNRTFQRRLKIATQRPSISIKM